MHTAIRLWAGGGGASSSDLTAVASNILNGKTAVHKESNDEPGAGTMPDIASIDPAKSLVLSSGTLYTRMSNGAHVNDASSGYPEVSVPQADLAAAIGLTADKIQKGKSILGITGTFEGYADTDYGNGYDMLANDMIYNIRTKDHANGTQTGTVTSTYARTKQFVVPSGPGVWPSSDTSHGDYRRGCMWLMTEPMDTRLYGYIVAEFYWYHSIGNTGGKYFTPFVSWLESDYDNMYSSSWDTVIANNVHASNYAKLPTQFKSSGSSTGGVSDVFRVCIDISKIQQYDAHVCIGGYVSNYTDNTAEGQVVMQRAQLYKTRPSESYTAEIAWS